MSTGYVKDLSMGLLSFHTRRPRGIAKIVRKLTYSSLSKFILALLLVTTLVASPRTSRAQDTDIGFVETVNIRGQWIDTASEDRILDPYSVIRSDSRVKVRTSRPDFFITLRIWGLDEPVTFRCIEPTVCADTLDLQPLLVRLDRGLLERFGAVIRALKTAIGKRPVIPRPLMGRAQVVSVNAPQDDVVIAEPGRMTTSRLFSTFSRGPLVVEYRSASTNNNDVAFNTIQVEWSGDLGLPLDIRPGLYEFRVRLAASPNARETTTESALVLAVAPTDYPRASALLEQGRQYVATLSRLDSAKALTLSRYLMTSFSSP